MSHGLRERGSILSRLLFQREAPGCIPEAHLPLIEPVPFRDPFERAVLLSLRVACFEAPSFFAVLWPQAALVAELSLLAARSLPENPQGSPAAPAKGAFCT